MTAYSKFKLEQNSLGIPRRGWTNKDVKDWIDSLWRDPMLLRWSGFFNAGGPDAVISWSNATQVFSVAPIDKSFAYFQYRNKLSYHIIKETHEIDLSEDIEEGLYLFYFGFNEETGLQELKYLFNPTEDEINEITLFRVEVAWLYWDDDSNEALYFGDSRHGSEWNAHIQNYVHTALKGAAKNGLYISGYTINGDGSSNNHARFTVVGGTMLNDDFELAIPSAATIPVLYQYGFLPRFLVNTGYGIYKGASRICYNTGGAVVQADTGYHVMYHVFATNEILTGSRKLISAMGTEQYLYLADAYENIRAELDAIYGYMPHRGIHYIGTLVFQTDENYINSIKARLVGIIGDGYINHPPVTIHENSADYLAIDWRQILEFKTQKLIQDIQILIDDSIEENNETNVTVTVPEIITSSVGGFKESFLIDNTAATSLTQESSWTVLLLRERVGEFRATVMVHDKSTHTVYSLQNVLGFDYIDGANEVSKDNEVIDDATVTLVLSIDASTKVLKASLSGMPANYKRIHFCFERCVLGTDQQVGMVANGQFILTAAALTSGYVELSASGTLILTASAIQNAYGEMVAAAQLALTAAAAMNAPVQLGAAGQLALTCGADLSDAAAPIDIKYGLLYNYPAMTDVRNIANSGAHICTLQEWLNLLNHISGGSYTKSNLPIIPATDLYGRKLRETGTSHWVEPNDVATDEYNFSARGGSCRGDDGTFGGLKYAYIAWAKDAVYTLYSFAIAYLPGVSDAIQISPTYDENFGFSICIVKDSTVLEDGETGIYTGNDGKNYQSICINGIEYVPTIAETKYRNGDTIAEVTDNAAWAALTTGALCAYDNDWDNV